MNTYINSFLCLSLLSICSCSSADDASGMDGNEEVAVVASMGGSNTKVNNPGTAFEANDEFHLYNTAYAPDKTALMEGRYAKYTYVNDKSCTSSETGKSLLWKNIMRDGNQYFFTATTDPEISFVETNQNTEDFLKKNDFLVARKVVKAADKWKPVHLRFHHVLCQINMEVHIPIGELDFQKDALTDPKLIDRQVAFEVTYGPNYTDENTGLITNGIGEYTSNIELYEVSKAVSSNIQKYLFRAIIPMQRTVMGQPFARFTIAGKTYTYRSTNNKPDGSPLSLAQGKIAKIVLKITKSSDIPIVLEPVMLLPWKEVNADMGELEPITPPNP